MAQVSDRWLSFGMWFFGFSAVVLTLDLATGMDKVTGFRVSLVVSFPSG
jgi:hypothetical protein